MPRRYYERAMFWLAAAAIAVVVGATLVGVGVEILGWTLVVVGIVLATFDGILYFRREPRDRDTSPRFEIVSAEWRCNPPLDHTPVYAERDCTAHVVLVNRGGAGNAVLVVRYVGIGRAGNVSPHREQRTVVPVTSRNGFAEVHCHVGKLLPPMTDPKPDIAVVQA